MRVGLYIISRLDMSCAQQGRVKSNPLSCATNRILNTQLAIVGLWSVIGVHRCYNLLLDY